MAAKQISRQEPKGVCKPRRRIYKNSRMHLKFKNTKAFISFLLRASYFCDLTKFVITSKLKGKYSLILPCRAVSKHLLFTRNFLIETTLYKNQDKKCDEFSFMYH